MKTAHFDASLDFSVGELAPGQQASLVLEGRKIPASFTEYQAAPQVEKSLVRVLAARAVDVRWLDSFDVLAEDGCVLGQGQILYPLSPGSLKLSPEKRFELLNLLSRGEREMLLALAAEKGIRGLHLPEVEEFCRLDQTRIEDLARQLEEDDQIRILSFSPLFIVSQTALIFLRERTLDFIARFHKSHPGELGPTVEKIGQRFNSRKKILSLVVQSLVRDGRVRREEDFVSLADFRVPMTPENEELLVKLENMLFRGEFATATLQEVRKQLRLSEGKLQLLLSVLTERKKVVQSRDGFILHSKWLDDLVNKIRESGKNELSVTEFKAMTGLSRKYAIPLLELLDEMGVTRRKGAGREIL
jgi:selenocysteine-specific elongation factor